jgi:tRNA-modifying protein YgfZ
MSKPDIAPRGPASIEQIAGRSVVTAYSEVSAEYDAMRRGAIVIDRSHRGRMRLAGAKAGEALTGLVTNDILALVPGQGLYAAALTAKGRIVADLRIFAELGGYFVDGPARAWDGWMSMVKKFVNPRLARSVDESERLRDIGIFGATSRHVVSALTGINGAALTALQPYAHVPASVAGAEITILRVPDIGAEGLELIVPAEAFDAIWSKAIECGAVPAGLAAWEVARVENGRPEWGIDIDESTIPQEANFDELGAISYTKGCYVGQEVVARVHFRGHVNRHLRGLRTAGSEPPPTGARLTDESTSSEAREVGEVRSAVRSPRLGGIALGMVRREVAVGTSLVARWEGGEQRVDVTALPFPG